MTRLANYKRTTYIGGLFSYERGSEYALDQSFDTVNIGSLFHPKYYKRIEVQDRNRILLAGRISQSDELSFKEDLRSIYNNSLK